MEGELWALGAALAAVMTAVVRAFSGDSVYRDALRDLREERSYLQQQVASLRDRNEELRGTVRELQSRLDHLETVLRNEGLEV